MFNNEGEFILKFGSNGEGNGQFNAPTGVAVDINGNIIVADWGNSRIQVRPKRKVGDLVLALTKLYMKTFFLSSRMLFKI